MPVSAGEDPDLQQCVRHGQEQVQDDAQQRALRPVQGQQVRPDHYEAHNRYLLW